MKTTKHITRCLFFLACGLVLFRQEPIPVQAAENSSLDGDATVSFSGDGWLTPPVDPENPGEVVDPGEIVATEGPLRLDFVPKIRFGQLPISDKDQTYPALAQLFKGSTPARGNYVQVTDHRATMQGWQLSVRQETQFRNENTKNKELKGAVLSFDNQWLNSVATTGKKPTIVKDAIVIDKIGTTYPIAIAEEGSGAGTWTIEFGSSGQVEDIPNTLTPIVKPDGSPLLDAQFDNKPMFKNKAIQLSVPGAIAKDPIKYTTVLTWTISELS